MASNNKPELLPTTTKQKTAGAAVGKADITSSENSQAQRIHQLCCSRPSKHQLNINKIRGRVAFLIN
jgi:hypothetical protein